MTARGRETRAEADERIVAEAGPWRNVTRWATPEVAGRQVVVTRYEGTGCPEAERAAAALARIANRLRKKGGRRG